MKVQKTENHSNKIMLSDDIGIMMSYPNIESVKGMMKGDLSETEVGMIVMKNSVQMVFTEEETHERDSFTEKELDDFFDSLTTDQFTKIRKFFDSMPVLKHTVKYNCKTCGEEKETTISGLDSFFGLA